MPLTVISELCRNGGLSSVSSVKSSSLSWPIEIPPQYLPPDYGKVVDAISRHYS